MSDDDCTVIMTLAGYTILETERFTSARGFPRFKPSREYCPAAGLLVALRGQKHTAAVGQEGVFARTRKGPGPF